MTREVYLRLINIINFEGRIFDIPTAAVAVLSMVGDGPIACWCKGRGRGRRRLPGGGDYIRKHLNTDFDRLIG